MKTLILGTALACGAVTLSVTALAAGHGAMDNANSGRNMAGHHATQTHDWDNAKASTTVAVQGCWIRSLPAPAPSGGYFVVHNRSKQQIKLQAAASPVYGMVMLHQTTEQKGMSKMSESHDIPISAGGKLEFKPGSYHAMLEQAVHAPAIGSKVEMSFLFDNGEKATAQCEVKSPNTRVN